MVDKVEKELGRRQFCASLAGACGLLVAPFSWSSSQPLAKSLNLFSLHTGERLSGTFWQQGDYHHPGLEQISHLMRDHRTDDQIGMDHRLLELLFRLDQNLGGDNEFHIISAYRSPKTNAMLNRRSTGVAKKSLHMQGMAVDIRVPGIALEQLRESALALRAGGVGFYRKSEFVHLDVGSVRQWGS